MLIDCDTCIARGPGCGDCVVTVLLGAPAPRDRSGVELDGAEQAAIAVLAGSGLVPPLRMAPGVGGDPGGRRGDDDDDRGPTRRGRRAG